MYFIEMDPEGGKGLGANNAGANLGTGYCDAQCPHDIKWISGEATVVDWVANPHDPNEGMGKGQGANNAGANLGTGYCDAQCPHDIKWISGEANVVDWVANPHDPNEG